MCFYFKIYKKIMILFIILLIFFLLLYNITKTIDQNNAKETYTLNTFFNTLKPLIDEQTLNKVQNIMNEFSIIIFGKELNLALDFS